MQYVEIHGLSRRYEGGFELRDINISLGKGEVYTLMGPSGSGKTSLLRNVCGLDTPEAGSVLVDGRDVTHIPTARRGIGLIFQDLALFPHMTVFANISYGLRAARWNEQDTLMRVRELASLLNIEDLLMRYPSQVSGGQRQRVALARSIAPGPSVLLLDEPLSSLDQQLRAEVRGELKSIASELGLTMIYVTHDQHEGLYMADRAGVMFEGVLERSGLATELFPRPGTERIARFFGYNVVTVDGSRVCFFPTEFELAQREADVSGVVRSVGYEGDVSRAHIQTVDGDAVQIVADADEFAGLKPGSLIHLRLKRYEKVRQH